MKKCLAICALLVLLLQEYADAENINGPADVRKDPGGKLMLSLNNNALVDCSPLRGDWYLIGFLLKLNDDRPTIKAGEVLVDQAGKEIGKALNDLDVPYKYEEDGYFLCEIIGHVYKDAIQKSSIIENRLENLINKKRHALTLSELAGHLREFGYHSWFDQGAFKSYLFYEDWMEDPSAGARIILFFYKDKLVALIHTRNLNIPYESRKFFRHYRFAYIESVDERTKKELEDYYYNIISHAD